MNEYLVNIIIAAALGAGTNELAIIAILRYVMPAKKGQIARRVRDIVATDLLSPEKMTDRLDDPAVGDLILRNIDSALAELLSRDLPSPRDLLAGHPDQLDSALARLREALLAEMSARTGDPAFERDTIRPFLAERWDALKHRAPASFLSGAAAGLPERAGEWVVSLEQSAPLRAGVRRALDGWLAARMRAAESLDDLLSPGLGRAAEDFAVSQAPAVIDALTDTLRDPDVADTVARSVVAAINAELRGQGLIGGLKGALASVMRVGDDIRGVCRRLPDALRDHLGRPDNRRRFEESLRLAVRNGLRRSLADDLKSPVGRGRLVDLVLDRMWRPSTFARLGGEVADLLRRVMASPLAATLEGVDGGPPSAILDEAAQTCARMLASSATREMAGNRFDELAAAWKERPIGRLERLVGKETRARAAAVAAEEARGMLRRRLAEFTEEAGMWDIVADSIESYDNRRLEDMVRQIASSELRWVTVLGGVIGAAVGLFQTMAKGWGWW